MGSDESFSPDAAVEAAAAGSRQDLARCVLRLRDQVLRCADGGMDGVSVGRLVAGVNDRILGRAAALTEEELGPPPCGYSLMVLGSEGRREQLLATDQDNALVFAGDDAPAQAYFEAFGGRLSVILVAAGFPPCPHGVMVDNPVWRRSASDWFGEVRAMTRVVEADAVLVIG